MDKEPTEAQTAVLKSMATVLADMMTEAEGDKGPLITSIIDTWKTKEEAEVVHALSELLAQQPPLVGAVPRIGSAGVTLFGAQQLLKERKEKQSQPRAQGKLS